jgi:hypothetical protein
MKRVMAMVARPIAMATKRVMKMAARAMTMVMKRANARVARGMGDGWEWQQKG